MSALGELTVRAFDAQVASDSPAPGGGSAAALAGATAAALVAMVCRLSRDRADVAAGEEELAGALDESERLRLRFLELVDEDAASFDAVMDALRLPKEDDAERAVRSAALAAAKLGAAAPPRETLAAARRTLELAAPLVGRTNANVVSDLGVAVALARAAAEGALLNVAVNLATLPPGEGADRLRSESRADAEAARTLADGAGGAVAAALGVGSARPG